MDFKITRTSVIIRLREYCAEHGLTCTTATVDRGQGLRLYVTIDGEEMTPGQAAERYLPAGDRRIPVTHVEDLFGHTVDTTDTRDKQDRCTTCGAVLRIVILDGENSNLGTYIARNGEDPTPCPGVRREHGPGTTGCNCFTCTGEPL